MNNYDNKQDKRWYSYTKYVDKDTGELIHKDNVKGNYIKINTLIEYEYRDDCNIKHRTTVLKKHPQLKIVF